MLRFVHVIVKLRRAVNQTRNIAMVLSVDVSNGDHHIRVACGIEKGSGLVGQLENNIWERGRKRRKVGVWG